MRPKEKAQELYNSYFHIVADTPDPEWRAKQGVIITVTEVLTLVDNQMKGWLDTDIIEYWKQVARETEKL